MSNTSCYHQCNQRRRNGRIHVGCLDLFQYCYFDTAKFIPDKVRIPAFITVIAAFVTIVQMLLKAFVPALDKSLGIYIPLIVVNCIILARAEAFASKYPIGQSAMDGLGMGVGFTIALTLIGAFREILGNGSIFNLQLFGENNVLVRCHVFFGADVMMICLRWLEGLIMAWANKMIYKTI